MKRKRVSILAGVVLALILVIIGTSRLLWSDPIVPVNIRQQITTTVLIPQQDNNVRINNNSFKFDTTIKLLSFTVSISGIKGIVTEQPTPEAFTDVPQVYDKVLAGLNEYSKIDTIYGPVHLLRPKDFQGDQSTALNAKGTLMFVRSENDLTNDQWQRFYNSLTIDK